MIGGSEPADKGRGKMSAIDETHDAKRESWVASARGHSEFPIQNLPLGVFSPPGGEPRGGVAIGDMIFDLQAALEAGLFSGDAQKAAAAVAGPALNPLMGLGPAPRVALRRRVSELLAADGPERAKAEGIASRVLHSAAQCTLHLPATIGEFTDFFAGIHHATNGGRRRDPNNPLSPNYKYVPVAYHSRASSVRPSNVPIRRPNGQHKAPDATAPSFGPCQKLDYEIELAVWVGPGNSQGEPIPIARAGDHIVGLGLVNDWSARDVQGWEYQPLGPFLGKNFGTTISPWIVTAEAMAPFHTAAYVRPAGDPAPLPYLSDTEDQTSGGLDITLEAYLSTETMRKSGAAPQRITQTSFALMYWTIAQMIAHHTCNGCNLEIGDLIGSGTVSGPDKSSWGSLLELTARGREPIALPGGEKRGFIEDGDEIVFRGFCAKPGQTRIGFGDCRAVILPAG